MKNKKIIAAILAVAMMITSIQLPPVQVRAAQMSEPTKFTDSQTLMDNARANSEESGQPNSTSENVDGNAKCAFDDPALTTWWHTNWHDGNGQVNFDHVERTGSKWIQTGFGKEWYLKNIVYTTRANGYCAINQFEIWTSNEDSALEKEPTVENGWTKVELLDDTLDDGNADDGEYTNAQTTEFTIELPKVVKAKYVCINVLSVYKNGCNGDFVIARNIDFYGYDADKTALVDAINEAEAKNESEYRLESWKAVEDALAEANEVNENAGATQDVVDDAVEALRAALDGLTRKTTDLREFDCAILAANAKANSWMQIEESKNGSASAAFDSDTNHWWHSNYRATTNQNVDGRVGDNNPIWIQTGFGGEWNIESIVYRTKGSDEANQIRN